MSDPFKFELGVTVEDRITGFNGIVIAQSHWLNNCNTYSVKSKKLKDGAPMKAEAFDEMDLILVEEKPVPAKNPTTGGPTEAVSFPNR